MNPIVMPAIEVMRPAVAMPFLPAFFCVSPITDNTIPAIPGTILNKISQEKTAVMIPNIRPKTANTLFFCGSNGVMTD